MATDEAVCARFVSIQRPGAADADAGHVCWGVLISDTMVVCRDLGWVEEADRWWDVLVAAPRPGGSGTAEHIRMREIDVLGSPGASGTVAVVKLAHAPAHEVRTDVVLDDFDEEEFYRALGAEGNVCAALEAVRVLPAVRPEGTVTELLGPVDKWQPDRRGLRVRSFDPRAPLAEAGGAGTEGTDAEGAEAQGAEARGAPRTEGIRPGEPPGGSTGPGTGGAAGSAPKPPRPPDRILLCFFKKCR